MAHGATWRSTRFGQEAEGMSLGLAGLSNVGGLSSCWDLVLVIRAEEYCSWSQIEAVGSDWLVYIWKGCAQPFFVPKTWLALGGAMSSQLGRPQMPQHQEYTKEENPVNAMGTSSVWPAVGKLLSRVVVSVYTLLRVYRRSNWFASLGIARIKYFHQPEGCEMLSRCCLIEIILIIHEAGYHCDR